MVIRDSFPRAYTGVTYTATQSGGAFGFNASGSGNLFAAVNRHGPAYSSVPRQDLEIPSARTPQRPLASSR